MVSKYGVCSVASEYLDDIYGHVVANVIIEGISHAQKDETEGKEGE